MALFRASFFDTLPWARMPSAICHPTVKTGFSAVEGSWKTMATSVPRSSRTRFGPTVSTSSPVRSTAPEATAVSGSRPRIVLAVTVLPDPDSPTIASTSPDRTVRLTPCTALTSPPSVAKVTSRFLMSTAV